MSSIKFVEYIALKKLVDFIVIIYCFILLLLLDFNAYLLLLFSFKKSLFLTIIFCGFNCFLFLNERFQPLS
jgi:hypothetical protein